MDVVTRSKTVTLDCPKHGSYTGELVRMSLEFGRGFVFNPPCPDCEKEFRAERKKQDEESRRARELQDRNIEKRFWASCFENFDAYTDELRRHSETCREFVKNPMGDIVMLGEHGNGKTHLAVSILKKLEGKIYTAFEIGVMLRQSYGGDAREWEILKELCSVPLLVIDEVEKVKDSESKQHWFSHVVGKRYNRMLPTIFIANCHTQNDCAERKKPCPKCLEYHLENDVLSRIIEDGITMKFTGGDYREKIKAERAGKKPSHGQNGVSGI